MYPKHSSYLKICFLLIPSAILGCSAEKRTVISGDVVGIQFICRTSQGEVMVGTDHESCQAQPKSPLYRKREEKGNIQVVAVSPSEPFPGRDRVLEEEVVERLRSSLVGRHTGEVFVANLDEDTPEPGKITQVLRVRERSKESSMSIVQYKGAAKKDPEVGQAVSFENLFPGKITKIEDGKVWIRFAPVVGKKFQLPLGEAVIKDAGDSFLIEIDAKPGALVRTGKFAGRITAVDDKFITVDYGHHFAGETLHCEVEVKTAEPPKPGGEGAR